MLLVTQVCGAGGAVAPVPGGSLSTVPGPPAHVQVGVRTS